VASHVKIGLWNTGLNPPGKKKQHAKKVMDDFCNIVDFLLNDCELDFLALLEVSVADYDVLRKKLGVGFNIIDASNSAGVNLYFDMVFVYRDGVFDFVDKFDLTKIYEGRTYKSAQQLNFILNDRLVHFFVSHWPSRIYAKPDDGARERIAETIANTIDRDIKGDASLVILMGDYNAEPFERCIQGSLSASRDFSLVEGNSKLFYNPFWRYFSYNKSGGVNGSYFYKNGWGARWMMYDQIIFSSAFVSGSSGLVVDDDSVCIFNHALIDAAYDRYGGKLFDHYPVLAVIKGK